MCLTSISVFARYHSLKLCISVFSHFSVIRYFQKSVSFIDPFEIGSWSINKFHFSLTVLISVHVFFIDSFLLLPKVMFVCFYVLLS